MWLAKDNRFLNPMSTYERNLMAPTCLIINYYFSWEGKPLVIEILSSKNLLELYHGSWGLLFYVLALVSITYRRFPLPSPLFWYAGWCYFYLIGRRSRFLSFLVSCLELTSLFHSFSFLISQVFPAVTDDFLFQLLALSSRIRNLIRLHRNYENIVT